MILLQSWYQPSSLTDTCTCRSIPWHQCTVSLTLGFVECLNLGRQLGQQDASYQHGRQHNECGNQHVDGSALPEAREVLAQRTLADATQCSHDKAGGCSSTDESLQGIEHIMIRCLSCTVVLRLPAYGSKQNLAGKATTSRHLEESARKACNTQIS